MSASHTNSDAVSAGDTWRELANRAGDGLEVSLLWDSIDDRVKVAVADSRLNAEFDFDVVAADALAAFHHPFAYAPSRSFGSLEADRESINLQTQA